MDLQTWKTTMELSGAAAFAVQNGSLICCTPEAKALGLRDGESPTGLLPALCPNDAAEQTDGTPVLLAGRTWTLRTLVREEATLCVLRKPAAELPAPNENTLRRAADTLRDAVRELTAALNVMTDLPAFEDPACARQAAEVLRSAYRIRRTAGEQTLYALLRADGYLLSRRRRPLVASAAELCGLCADVLRISGRSLRWTLPEREFPACIDWDLTALMLCELIDNAAVHGDGTEIRLELTRPSLDRVCFTVSNHAAEGLPPEPFHKHTTAADATDRAAGLGLDLVSAGAALHGGSLLLSADGRGERKALLTLRLAEREDPRLESAYQLPRGVDAVMIGLSTALPAEAFYPIDLL